DRPRHLQQPENSLNPLATSGNTLTTRPWVKPRPQATHHLVHRSVWQTTADNGAVLLASPRISPAEKDRLRAERERSMRVLEEIDAAAGKAG
ncbi:hypothetical protein ACWGCW_37890, partial [Streptomyces sp. NPDC054933]